MAETGSPSYSPGELVYALHHELDPVNLAVVDKVLKLSCFRKSKAHYDWDFVNDIGIINLLRRDYLSSGDLLRVFNLYQSTRRDPRCHRYESVLALLVIAIVGTVVGGIVVEHYSDYKDKLGRWVKEKLKDSGFFGKAPAGPLALERLADTGERTQLLGKFCDSTAKAVLADFEVLVKCYTARRMLDEGFISYVEYQDLVGSFLGTMTESQTEDELTAKFCEYGQSYVVLEDAIRTEKVALTVDAYAKGILATELDAVHIQILAPANTPTADVLRGVPASSGAAKGIAHVFAQRRPKADNVVLVVDSSIFTPAYIDLLRASPVVVTTNCGMTGHIPLICRGWRKGCVILGAEDFARIRNGDAIIACGTTGIVATGLMADSHRLS